MSPQKVVGPQDDFDLRLAAGVGCDGNDTAAIGGSGGAFSVSASRMKPFRQTHAASNSAYGFWWELSHHGDVFGTLLFRHSHV